MPHPPLNCVFVYGTLQVGGVYHRLVAPFVRGVVAGHVDGQLLDLGAYPGWVAGSGTVRGQVLTLERVAEALAVLDELEDYRGPGHPGNLYRREVVAARTPGGSVEAWAYRYLGSREGCPSVPGGRWRPGRRGQEDGGSANRPASGSTSPTASAGTQPRASRP